MTPQEKAKELIEKFRFGKPISYLEREADEIEFAKQCALIAVNEILRLMPTNNTLKLSDYSYINFKYWQEVRKQIEKL